MALLEKVCCQGQALRLQKLCAIPCFSVLFLAGDMSSRQLQSPGLPAASHSYRLTLFPLETESPTNPSFYKFMVFCLSYGKVINTPACLIGEPRYQ